MDTIRDNQVDKIKFKQQKMVSQVVVDSALRVDNQALQNWDLTMGVKRINITIRMKSSWPIHSLESFAKMSVNVY